MPPPALPQDLSARRRPRLAEDIGPGDVTADLVPAGVPRRHGREPGGRRAVRHGLVRRGLRAARSRGFGRVAAADGERVGPGATLCRLEGPARPLLSGERTALNFLQSLVRHRHAARTLRRRRRRHRLPRAGHAQDPARPALGAEVRGRLRRRHQSPPRPVRRPADQGKPHHRGRRHCAALPRPAPRTRASSVEIEVESPTSSRQALDGGADIVLLDNFGSTHCGKPSPRAAARLHDPAGGLRQRRARHVRAVAETGVDFVSVGGITKHLRAIDLSMRFRLGAGFRLKYLLQRTIKPDWRRRAATAVETLFEKLLPSVFNRSAAFFALQKTNPNGRLNRSPVACPAGFRGL
jgi:nicotinate-nucleotide pyrophosphorylase (carboxylating)